MKFKLSLNLKKVNGSRFKNPYFWLAIASIAYLVLKDTNIISFTEEKFQEYFDVISAFLIISGVWTDPTTPGISDNVDDYIEIKNING